MRSDERSLLSDFWSAMRSPVAPEGRGYLRFGWLLLILLAAQAISGMLLAVYYRPTPELATRSVVYITREVRWGWLIRGIHHWAAYGLLVLAAVQFVRVLVQRAYRAEGRSSWTLGLLLTLLLVGLAVTGDWLPWDVDSHRAAEAVLREVDQVPWLGSGLGNLLRGGPEVGAPTLGRAWVLHGLLLPSLALSLVFVQLWMLARRRRLRREATR